MPGQLVCRPQQDLPVALLRVSGTLDQVTGDALQQALRRSLAGQPEVLLLDVSELRVADPVGLTALSAVVGQTAEWPGVPIVVCGADPGTAEAIAASPGCAELGIAADCSAALAQASTSSVPRRIRVRLRPVPDACRQVRQLVAQVCAGRGPGDFTATAALVATELVANVVRHAHTTMDFTMGLADGRLSMSVRDGSRRLPRPADPAVTDAGGRGLRLVRELTDAWGVLPIADGKVVWTRLSA
ncbi:ATP-binding protein [Micromonosporaceae bacterium Da 78-11]